MVVTSEVKLRQQKGVKELNTKKDDSYLKCPVTFFVAFGIVLVAFGVVSLAPRTGWWVIVAYEPVGEARVNTITMTCWSRDCADDIPGITRERRRECLYVTTVLL